MSKTLPVSSLPKVLQDFLRARKFKKRTVRFDAIRDEAVSVLDPRREYHSEYDDFDPGDLVYAVSLRDGRWQSQPSAGSEPLRLAADGAPWAWVTLYGRSGGGQILVGYAGEALLAKVEPISVPSPAAQLLHCYTKVRAGNYRSACVVAMGQWNGGQSSVQVWQDWLQEHGLIKLSARSYMGRQQVAVNVTPRGQEVAAGLPHKYDPLYGAHRSTMTEEPYVLSGGFSPRYMRVPGGR